MLSAILICHWRKLGVMFEKRKYPLRLRKKFIPWLFLAAPLFLFSVWVIGPAFYTIYISFTKTTLVSPTKFIGFKNYELLFTDPTFYLCLINNAKWIIFFLIIPVVISLFLAIGIYIIKSRKIATILKTIFFLPMAISLAAASLIWTWVYHPENGLLNTVLRKLGLNFMTHAWLAEPFTALFSVIVGQAWIVIPLLMIFFLTGLNSIRSEFIEAAKIDGANFLHIFRYILLPLLKPVFVVVIIITIEIALITFDMVFLMTQGGNYTNVMAVYMYRTSFYDYNLGSGASIAVILMLLTIGFIYIQLRRYLRREIIY